MKCTNLCQSSLPALALSAIVLGTPEKAEANPEADAARFATVSKQLDSGGTLYAYVSVNGDLRNLAVWVGQLVESIRKENPQDIPFPIDAPRILEATGLDSVSAVGFSSRAAKAGFQNKSYFHTPAGRKGLLCLFGGEPKIFEGPNLAPAGTEFVYEQELNFKALYEVALDIAGVVMGDAGKGMIQMAASQPFDEKTELTAARLLRDANTKVTVIVDAHDTKKFRIPGEDFDLPLTHGAVLVNGFGWLADEVARLSGDEPDAERVREANWRGIRSSEVLGEGGLATYRPALLHHLPSGKLVLTTQTEFAEMLFIPKPNLREDRAFREVMKGLPERGNAMSYVSPKVFNLLRKVVNAAIEQEADPAEAAVVRGMLSLFLPLDSKGEASVTTNLPDGILTVSNSTFSHKGGLLSFGLTGPMAGIMASQMMFMGAMEELEDGNDFPAPPDVQIPFEEAQPEIEIPSP